MDGQDSHGRSIIYGGNAIAVQGLMSCRHI